MSFHFGRTQLPLSARVLIFFISNPDEELTTEDIVAKFDCDRGIVTHSMRGAVSSNILAKVSQRGKGGTCTYTAGPRLLEEIGLTPKPDSFTRALKAGFTASGQLREQA